MIINVTILSFALLIRVIPTPLVMMVSLVACLYLTIPCATTLRSALLMCAIQLLDAPTPLAMLYVMIVLTVLWIAANLMEHVLTLPMTLLAKTTCSAPLTHVPPPAALLLPTVMMVMIAPLINVLRANTRILIQMMMTNLLSASIPSLASITMSALLTHVLEVDSPSNALTILLLAAFLLLPSREMTRMAVMMAVMIPEQASDNLTPALYLLVLILCAKTNQP